MTVARVALPLAAPQTFDYWVPAGLAVARGSVVRARIARRALAGVVVGVDQSESVARERLHSIEEVADLPSLPDDVTDMCDFVASYYQSAPGLAHALALPPLLRRRGRAASGKPPVAAPTAAAPATLNDDQARAVAALVSALGSFSPFLLHGATGSGKTEVYLAAAREALARGGQVLVLVPEINLTPQFESRLRGALPNAHAVTLHSALSDGERRASWLAAARGEASLVLGTRLALFTPLPALALIVVDEEHDDSFKQNDGVRYHARDIAVWRAHRRNVPIVLGSATPSIESFAHADAGRYTLLELPRRAPRAAAFPSITFVAPRGHTMREGLSQALVDALSQRLERREQALVFVNRRGFAPSLKCVACGWQAGCPRCAARLVLHRDPDHLRCHHCGHRSNVIAACPECGNVDLLPLGSGTQRLERALHSLFPAARIARIDRDTTRAKGAFSAIRAQIEAAELDILIGTQMLAKGHDFPRLTLVGVLGADNALYSADFRSTERLAALLTQVAGRAGRAGLAGEVIVQTDFPEHPVFSMLATHDYARFARTLLEERRIARLPPASHVAILLAEAHARADVDRFLDDAHAFARERVQGGHGDVEVFAPVPALLARRAGYERGQLVVQSERRSALQAFLPQWRDALPAIARKRVRYAIDVDPAGFC
jgi:primosomal protein N' (replication factor Y)